MGFIQWLLNLFNRNTVNSYSGQKRQRQEEDDEEEEIEELVALDII